MDISISASEEVPALGSTSFALECHGSEFPWEARLDSEAWYKSGAQLPLDDSVSTEILHDSYNPSAFNVTYIFRSRVIFDRPLTFSDRGEYSCNVSVLLTYPDESTYLLTNSTTYILNISGMCNYMHDVPHAVAITWLYLSVLSNAVHVLVQ